MALLIKESEKITALKTLMQLRVIRNLSGQVNLKDDGRKIIYFIGEVDCEVNEEEYKELKDFAATFEAQ